MADTAPNTPLSGSYEYWKNELAVRCKETDKNWAMLKKILDRDYTTICHTWRENEKSALKRTNILDRAFHCGTTKYTLPLERRPDINGWVQRNEARQPEDMRFPAWQFPYLSEEDLVHGENILMFACHRAKHHWTEYFHTDLYATRGGQPLQDFHGFRIGQVPVDPPKETNDKVLYVKKREPGEIPRDQPAQFDDYWEEYDSTNKSHFERTFLRSNRKAVAKGIDVLDKFSYSQALLITASQNCIYSYLVDVCMDIFLTSRTRGDKNTSVSRHKELKAALQKEYEEHQHQNDDLTPPTKPPDGTMLPSLTEVRLRATYGPPDGFEWDVLEKLIDSRVAGARTALLQLRKDPDIYEAAIRREEWKRDENYNPTVAPDLVPKHGEFQGPTRLKAWQDAMKFCIGDAIKDFDRWSELQDALISLRATYEKHEKKLGTKDKSEEFWAAAKKLDTALYGFYYRAHHFSERLVGELQKTVFGSSFFRKYVIIQDVQGVRQPVFTDALQPEGQKKLAKIILKLTRLFTHQRQQFGLSALLDDLERELMHTSEPNNTEPSVQDDQIEDPSQEGHEDVAGQGASKKKKKKKKKAKKNSGDTEQSNKDYLTEEVLEILGNLAVFAECLSQVEHFQPWVTLYFADWNHDPQKEDMRESVERLEKYFQELTGSDRAWKIMHRERGLPKLRRFHYPVGELRTQENVDLLEAAESNLDLFWDDLLEELKPDKQDALSDRARALLEETPKRTQWRVQGAEEPGNEKAMPDLQEQRQDQEETQASADVEMLDASEVAAMDGTRGSRPKTPSPPKRAREEDEEPADQSPTKKKKSAKGSKKSTKNRQELTDTDQSGKILLPVRLYPHVLSLFFVPGRTDAKKTLQWNDFIKLMNNIGFGARPAGGSIYKFEPIHPTLIEKLPKQKLGAFEVHKPHPEKFLRFWQCRRIGDALHAKYAWTSDTFGPQLK